MATDEEILKQWNALPTPAGATADSELLDLIRRVREDEREKTAAEIKRLEAIVGTTADGQHAPHVAYAVTSEGIKTCCLNVIPLTYDDEESEQWFLQQDVYSTLAAAQAAKESK